MFAARCVTFFEEKLTSAEIPITMLHFIYSSLDETGASRGRLGPQESQEAGEAVELDLVVRQIWCIVFIKRPVHFFYQTAVQGCFVRESIVIIVFSFEHKIGRPIFKLYGLQYPVQTLQEKR